MKPNRRWRWLSTFLFAALLCCMALSASAQGSSGVLVLGQPIPNQVAVDGLLTYDYVLNQTSQVTIQALSDSAKPTLTITRGGQVVAQQPNDESAFTTSLSEMLSPGTYSVQVATRDNTAGLIIVVLQSEVPIPASALTPSVPINAIVGAQVPLALYTFAALDEPGFLYVDAESAQRGVSVTVVNTTSGETSGHVAADLLGVRFRISAGSVTYQVQVEGGSTPEPFTICFAAVSSGGCEVGSTPIQATAITLPTTVPTVIAVACTISPSAPGGVNIRQSSSTLSLIIGRLPTGQSATVTGISPDRTFWNVIYDNKDGWIATSVVNASGSCNAVPPVMPPPIIPQPTAIPPTAVPPTAAPTQDNSPCLITITSDTLVYSYPQAIPDYIYDETMAGYQLIPTGRLTDNSWWVTNYANAWIETSHFGNSATVSGNCSNLPVVAPPP